ncbi:MAG: NADH:ubiquinone reductase (Na(+)-transporting) subunit E [Candidatus Omnitrophica bacterium]|nr:NADH:ubiquinone reductase (Na(+)-transporting) subunit E [Candidatus Omnitrophota bacterium]
MQTHPLLIFLGAIFAHNIALVYIIGMCPLIVISKSLKTALGMGISVVFVVILTACLNWLIYHLILLPLGVEILAYLIFIITIATSVQFLEMVIERFFPPLQATFGIFLPLITVNCIVLAISLFMVLRDYDFIRTFAFAGGTSLGWALVIVTLAAIKERLMLTGDIPKGLKGAGITMVILGILALGFMGFAGMVKM